MHFNVLKKMTLGILVVLAAQNATSATKVITAKKMIGKGFVYSWIEYHHNIRFPSAFGLSISASATDSLPDEMLDISLQPPRKFRVPPFQHFYVNWNPHGHDPVQIYGLPHFDFHFYTISSASREDITCMDADAAVCTKTLPPELIAKNYVPTPAGVPLMGWHWVDSTSPEFHGTKFTSTFIYGYYDAKMTFLEPMVTLEYLESHPNAILPIPEPEKVSFKGWYPRKYIVRFNSAMDSYEVSLTNLHFRDDVIE